MSFAFSGVLSVWIKTQVGLVSGAYYIKCTSLSSMMSFCWVSHRWRGCITLQGVQPIKLCQVINNWCGIVKWYCFCFTIVNLHHLFNFCLICWIWLNGGATISIFRLSLFEPEAFISFQADLSPLFTCSFGKMKINFEFNNIQQVFTCNKIKQYHTRWSAFVLNISTAVMWLWARGCSTREMPLVQSNCLVGPICYIGVKIFWMDRLPSYLCIDSSSNFLPCQFSLLWCCNRMFSIKVFVLALCMGRLTSFCQLLHFLRKFIEVHNLKYKDMTKL